MIIAPRGPRKVLWVVVVIISAKLLGEGYILLAINPAICEISAIK
jgi:hypothetical protein